MSKSEQSVSKSVEGNTNSSTAKKPITQSKKWCFTLNNYKDEWIEQIEQVFIAKGYKYVFGQEVGESGTPHLQGYIESEKKLRPSEIKFGGDLEWSRFHWEKKSKWSTVKQASEYCTKDGLYRTNMYFVPKYTLEIDLYDWQKTILDIVRSEPDDRSIYWIWESKGCTGKTTFQKYLFMKEERVIVTGGNANDMKNGIIEYEKKNGWLPRTVCINIPRVNEGHYSVAGIESIKDMFFYSGKYEGGMVCGANPHVLIFSNHPPDQEQMSEDRWRVYDLNDLSEL